MADNDPKAVSAVKRFERARSQRGNFEQMWQETADLMMPTRQFTAKLGPGQRRDRRQFDSTAMMANVRFASAMHGFLTNPATQWFALRASEDDVNSRDDARKWLDIAQERVMALMSNPRFGFDTQSQEVYQDLGAFGTAVMIFEDRPGDIPHFSARPLSECYLEPDSDFNVRAVHRLVKFDLADAIDKFGLKNMAPKHRLAVEGGKDPFDIEVNLVHSVWRRTKFDSEKKDPMNKPVGSIWVDLDCKHVVKEGGFDRWPFMTPRIWKSTDEVYGRGIGTMLLADIGMVNAMRALNIEAAEIAAHPPMEVQAHGTEGPLDLGPRGLVYTRMGSQQVVRPIITGSRVELGEAILDKERENLRSGFMLDMMTMPEFNRATTVEVLQWVQQRMVFLSAIMARMTTEWLSPLIHNTFWWAKDNDVLPPLPPSLRNERLEVDFVSVMALSQKAGQATAFTQWLTTVAPIAGVDPQIFDNLDTDAVSRDLAFGVHHLPRRWFRSDRDVIQIRQARAEATAQMQQLQAGNIAAQTAESGASAAKLFSEAQAA